MLILEYDFDIIIKLFTITFTGVHGRWNVKKLFLNNEISLRLFVTAPSEYFKREFHLINFQDDWGEIELVFKNENFKSLAFHRLVFQKPDLFRLILGESLHC